MGRGSEIFWFINEEEIPGSIEMQHHYRYISKTPDVMALRKAHLKRKRDERKKDGITKDDRRNNSEG